MPTSTGNGKSAIYRWFSPCYKPPFVGDSQPKTFDCQRLPQPLHEISLHPHAENSPTSSHTAWWIVTAKMSLWRKHGGPCRRMSSQSPASLAGLGEGTDPHSLVSSNVAGESSTKFIAWKKIILWGISTCYVWFRGCVHVLENTDEPWIEATLWHHQKADCPGILLRCMFWEIQRPRTRSHFSPAFRSEMCQTIQENTSIDVPL